MIYDEHAEIVVPASAPKELWLQARRSMITASDAAALTNNHHYVTWDDLITRKITGDTFEPNAAMWMGSKREQNNICLFAECADITPGWELAGALLRSKRYPYLGCTLDSYVEKNVFQVPRAEVPDELRIDLPPEAKKVGTVIEAKNVRSRSRSVWKKPPNNTKSRIFQYWAQVQLQMLVTGAPMGLLFAVVDACELYHHVIPASPDYQDLLITQGKKFMDDLDGMNF